MTTTVDPLFTLKPEEYGRTLDFHGECLKDSATYLSKVMGTSYEDAYAFVTKATGPGGEFEMHEPVFQCLVRGSNGDRAKKNIPFSQYRNFVLDGGHITSPTFVVYRNPAEEESMWSKYIGKNMKKRDKAKEEQMVAKRNGDKETETQKKIEQVNAKVKNNSMSGAQASQHTPMHNKSAHSSLTSTCRSAATSANASNERFFMGNRHYYDLDIVLANIVSIINNSDYETINQCISVFGLVCPTVEEVTAAIKYSTDLYWENPVWDDSIHALVSSLSAVERAAYLYTGDFYHLTKLNPDFTRKMLHDLIQRPEPLTCDPYPYLNALDGDLRAYIGILCSEELQGASIGEIPTKVPQNAAIIGAVAKQLKEVLEKHRCFFKAFWVTPNIPASMASFPSSIRAAAIVSDTDSTIFTVAEWAMWYCNNRGFTKESDNVVATMIYLGSQVLTHVLATISGNMGVVASRIHQLAMKNEYMFPVFVPTGLAKHYYAYMSAQEGDVFKEFRKEIKGVHLKSSKVPPVIIEGSNALLTKVMDYAYRGQQMSAAALLKEIGDVERMIMASLKKGSLDYLTSATVGPLESYTKQPGNYFHYMLWEDVFAQKYGHAPVPPYRTVRVSIDVPNQTAYIEWLDGLEDQDLADRFRKCAEKNNKKIISSILIPVEVTANNGIPQEILDGMNVRSLLANTMKSYYIILESLGLFFTNKHNTKLVSDFY